jgi:hypothetical protein
MTKPMMIVAAAAALALAGCAGSPHKPDPLNLRELLVFSGFTLKVAATQGDLDQLGSLPQRELLRVGAGIPPLYIWADAMGCQCWYVGDQNAYQRLLSQGWENKAE